MATKKKHRYQGDDLVAVVWPIHRAQLVRARKMTWQQAACGAWAMDPAKAERVRVLIAADNDQAMAAWPVTSVSHHAEAPEGSTRLVSRSTFETGEDPRLDYLVGAPSPRPRQRNPQTTFELRDLPGADSLIGDAKPDYGVVHLGQFTLTVSEDGRADLRMPAGTTLIVRTAV